LVAVTFLGHSRHTGTQMYSSTDLIMWPYSTVDRHFAAKHHCVFV